MADWGQFWNFEPASEEECKAARTTQGGSCGAPATCNPVDTCSTKSSCSGPTTFDPMLGAPKKITDLLGDTVVGKNCEVPVKTFAKPNSVVGIFFSGYWCPPSRQFTPMLIAFYKRFKQKHKDKAFEIVFVSSDRTEAEFDDYYGEMPWLTIPYHKREEKQKISKKFGVTGIPTLVLVDGGTGELITKNGREIPTEDPEGNDYPWKPRPFNQVIREGSLVDNKGVEFTVDFAIKGKITGVFFSGHWCPPSQAFTPKLVESYNYLQKQGKNFEIIFCSWDRSQKEFDEYFAEMPWMAVPYNDKRGKQLKKLYGVTGIPHLTILDESGKIITKNGRGRIEEDPFGEDFPWHRKPLVRLTSSTAEVINESPTVILIAEKESDIPDIENLLLDLAKEHHDKGENQEIFFMYITKETDTGLLPKLLDIMKLKHDLYPLLMLTDLPKQKYYIYEGPSPVAGSARELVDGYVNKTMKGKLIY